MCENMQEICEQFTEEIWHLTYAMFGFDEDDEDCLALPMWKKDLVEILEKFSETIVGQKKKRNRSAYAIFCADNRDKVKEKFGLTNPRDVIRKLGEIWAKMKEEKTDKFKKYEQIALDEKKQNGHESRSRSRSPRAKTAREKSPKRTSAYLMFSAETRKTCADEIKGKPLGEASQFIAQKWEKVKKDEKRFQMYSEMAAEHDRQKCLDGEPSQKEPTRRRSSDVKPTGKSDPREPIRKGSNQKEPPTRKRSSEKELPTRKRSNQKENEPPKMMMPRRGRKIADAEDEEEFCEEESEEGECEEEEEEEEECEKKKTHRKMNEDEELVRLLAPSDRRKMAFENMMADAKKRRA